VEQRATLKTCLVEIRDGFKETRKNEERLFGFMQEYLEIKKQKYNNKRKRSHSDSDKE